MATFAVEAENLSKKYQIGSEKVPYRTLRESIIEGVRAPFQRAVNLIKGQPYAAAEMDQEIWALKELNFEIYQGETVGIIGRNGAGKSTLLKVLSRITEPTEGRAKIRGRVGSLLEVGTGFHPELTGRENIYLNGSILGMRRQEIEQSFDAIVDFSEVRKFLDTPVKHYSSGMYVRLAFSVAAHLNPEILLVDEVLAVGDVSFQKKCLGKMGDVAGSGRTVLFVSHNMGMIQSLCERVILLESGKIVKDGDPERIISYYLETYGGRGQSAVKEIDANDQKRLQIRRISLVNQEGNNSSIFDISESIQVVIDFRVHEKLMGTAITMKIFQGGTVISTSFDVDFHDELLSERHPGKYQVKATIPSFHLKPGQYSIDVGAGILNRQKLDYVENAVSFDVDTLQVGDKFKSYSSRREGLVTIPVDWDYN